MMRVSEFRKWLDSLEPDDMIAVDEGGLAIVLVGDESVFSEIGGVPLEDSDR